MGHYGAKFPTCPHCDYVHEDEWWNYAENDETEEVKCKGCGETFSCSRSDVPSFDCVMLEDET